MLDNQQDMIRKAKKKLLNNVLKINNITRVFLFFLAILSTYIYKEILLQYNDSLILDRKNTDIILIPFFIFWGLFYLSARQINKINNSRWRFWVLKNIHYVQDFVEIKKFAERRNYIKTTENFLDKEYIIRKSKKPEHKKLLDKLEIFEYAFARNLEDNLPENFIYKVDKLVAILRVSWLFLWLGVIPLLALISAIVSGKDFELYGAIVFVSVLIPLFILIFIKWYSPLFIKTVHLEANLKGVKIKDCGNNNFIFWEYVKEIKYDSELIGEDTVYFIYFYLKETSFFNKIKNNECKVATNILKLRGDIIYQQVNAMHQKYLKMKADK